MVAVTETVAEATEATCRRMMAKRAGLADVWQHRVERRALLAEVDELLVCYAVAAWGPAPWRV